MSLELAKIHCLRCYSLLQKRKEISPDKAMGNRINYSIRKRTLSCLEEERDFLMWRQEDSSLKLGKSEKEIAKYDATIEGLEQCGRCDGRCPAVALAVDTYLIQVQSNSR
jgi:hypothetical protein